MESEVHLLDEHQSFNFWRKIHERSPDGAPQTLVSSFSVVFTGATRPWQHDPGPSARYLWQQLPVLPALRRIRLLRPPNGPGSETPG